jgi:hypothetical protein
MKGSFSSVRMSRLGGLPDVARAPSNASSLNADYAPGAGGTAHTEPTAASLIRRNSRFAHSTPSSAARVSCWSDHRAPSRADDDRSRVGPAPAAALPGVDHRRRVVQTVVIEVTELQVARPERPAARRMVARRWEISESHGDIIRVFRLRREVSPTRMRRKCVASPSWNGAGRPYCDSPPRRRRCRRRGGACRLESRSPRA